MRLYQSLALQFRVTFRVKFLNVSTGRCGSTLLSAILAHAGADFGMGNNKEWNRASGDYEHPDLDTAYKWHRAGQFIHQEIWPFNRLSNICRTKRDRAIRSVFDNVKYAKTIELVHLIQPIEKLGYDFRIILTYRDFEGFARSWYRRFGWNMSRLKEYYLTINQTGLLQLKIYGGCAISFEEITSPETAEWATALEELTGLEENKLLEKRDELLRKPRHKPLNEPLHSETQRLFDKLEGLQGTVVKPSIKI